MAQSFKLPDLGEGIQEGEIRAVLVAVGDEVKEDDLILEVETDKATVEIPSPFSGFVKEIRASVGDIVNVGDVLIIFGEEEEETEQVDTASEPLEATPPPSVGRRDAGPVPASPATRRLARELGVDLAAVTPTGPGGLVTAEDVRSYGEGKTLEKETPETPAITSPQRRGLSVEVPPLPDFTRWGPAERVPVRSIRRATAKQMILSWSQIPHVTSQNQVDITRLENFRQKHRAEIEEKGGRLTLTVFALKAAATALKTYPNFNSSLDTEAGEIVIKHYYHIGVAVNTADGLIVPVIRDVDRKSIVELAAELTELGQQTHERKTALAKLQGGTFTITNVGPMGGGHFAPIINYPQVAILGMGAATLKPVVIQHPDREHEIVPRLIMPLVLCFDHRVLDGADALRFTRVITNALEDPDELLMTMT